MNPDEWFDHEETALDKELRDGLISEDKYKEALQMLIHDYNILMEEEKDIQK